MYIDINTAGPFVRNLYQTPDFHRTDERGKSSTADSSVRVDDANLHPADHRTIAYGRCFGSKERDPATRTNVSVP